jgi:3-deoxy-D-manno-octulosonic-acid transferase
MMGDVVVLYAPIDLTFSVRKALSGVRPDVMVFLETEIWPSWLFEAHRIGIRTALINGRVSNRSIRRYLRLRPFFVDVLKNIDAFSMIGTEDARRISEMGADLKKIEINGNAKYEMLADQADSALEADMRRILNLEPSHPVFVAGSTRDGEETLILDVYEKILKQFPDAILVIAPRHVVRTPTIEFLLRTRGFRYQLHSELKSSVSNRTEQVVVMNTFGELFKLYSVGTINFCGASLVPLGGQNPMEAAVWGKAVFYGPSMEDFADAKGLLESEDAGIQVEDAESFGEKALWFLNHPDELRERGKRAERAARMNLGAAEKHAGVITGLL